MKKDFKYLKKAMEYLIPHAQAINIILQDSK